MPKRNNFLRLLLLFIAISNTFLIQNCFANVLSWNDLNVYKPNPVLFLHGFARGNSKDWDPAKSSLAKYYSKYANIHSYLENFDFQDANGSIDRYSAGKFNPQGNSAGWADKVNNKVNELLNINNYGSYTNKFNLVCHSMGGLAVRWYLANYSDDFVDKLILIGAPNLGTRWAELANIASKVPKVGWMQLLNTNGIASVSKSRDVLSFVLLNLKDIDIYGEAVKDMDPTSSGSGFINNLNSVAQTNKVSYYGVVGIISSFMNRIIANGDYYGGDGIVSKTSQLGTGVVTYKEWAQVDAIHWEEIEKAGSGSFSPILFFLDSTPPEFTLDSPQENSTTEINTNSISVKGKVFKEYLPADSEIIISGFRQEDGAVLNQINYLLKPSSFWIPNNPDSPVAEFDETIAFPGQGTYKISCQIQNPAGLTSDTKVFWIKVIAQSNANIIVHGHNSEGKEINSITGFANTVAVYDGSTPIGYAGSTPITILFGHHAIKVKFNGMTLTKEIDIVAGATQELTFTFTRTVINLASQMNRTGSFSGSKSGSTPFEYGYSMAALFESISTPGGDFIDNFYWLIDGQGFRNFDPNYDYYQQPPIDWTLSGSGNYILTPKNFTTNFSGSFSLSGGSPHIPESVYYDFIRYFASFRFYFEIPTPNSYGFQSWYGSPSYNTVIRGDKYSFYYDFRRSQFRLDVVIDSGTYAFQSLSASHEYSVPLGLGELNVYSVPY